MAFHTLVSADILARHIDDPCWRIVDCRHDLTRPDAGEQAYLAGHIPNAQFLHLDRHLSGPKTGRNGRHPLPDPATLAVTLSRCGVSNDTQVVAYDDAGGLFAARLWWLSRWLGHNNVALLDGGLAAWQRAGHALTDRIPSTPPAAFCRRSVSQCVDTDYVYDHLYRSDMLLIDARAPERFRGENENIDPVAGHIPGAINRFFRENLAADCCFKPADQLRKEFDELLGNHAVETTVSYCGSGVTACHNLLALEIAGRRGGRLYPGSWSEWCSDPKRPVAKQPASQ